MAVVLRLIMSYSAFWLASAVVEGRFPLWSLCFLCWLWTFVVDVTRLKRQGGSLGMLVEALVVWQLPGLVAGVAAMGFVVHQVGASFASDLVEVLTAPFSPVVEKLPHFEWMQVSSSFLISAAIPFVLVLAGMAVWRLTPDYRWNLGSEKHKP